MDRCLAAQASRVKEWQQASSAVATVAAAPLSPVPKKIKFLVRAGIPASLRAKIWFQLSGASALQRGAAPDAYAANLKLLPGYKSLANEVGCTPAQLALAWLLHKSPCVVPIPGTTNPAHLVENLGAQAVVLGPDLLARLERLFNPDAVCGPRYNATSSAEVDTEQFDS